MSAILKNNYLMIFLICFLGYLLGSISVRGVSLGTSGILLVALIFGHFGIAVPGVVKTLGLVCFVGSVGAIAGPVFFENFKKGALNFIILGFVTIFSGVLACVAAIKLLGIDTPLCVGMLTGALTSTPGLAAALEATGNNTMASVGYGIAYPFGVLGVVLFVQLVPRILHTDIPGEMAEMIEMTRAAEERSAAEKKIQIDPYGFWAFSLIIVLGVLIGLITIPLGRGASFSLGTSGGPLISGLLIGHFGHIGNVSLVPPKKTLNVMREFGLALFLLGAGTEAGQGFLDVLKEQGVKLFIVGIFFTLIPMVIVYVVAKKFMKMKTMNALGSICGGMTSTPALGTLIATAGTDAVAISYAATYPIALLMIVVCSQLIALLC